MTVHFELIHKCGTGTFYRVRFYNEVIDDPVCDINNIMYEYGAVSNLDIIGTTAHSTAFVARDWYKFNSAALSNALEVLHLLHPEVTLLIWERHTKGKIRYINLPL